jgi:hypothetical protein
LGEAGFENVEIRVRQREFIQTDAIQGELDNYVASANVTAFKPNSSPGGIP